MLRSGEFALLHGDIASDVKIMDLDVRVREGVKPAAEELGTGRFFLAGHPCAVPKPDVGSDLLLYALRPTPPPTRQPPTTAYHGSPVGDLHKHQPPTNRPDEVQYAT